MSKEIKLNVEWSKSVKTTTYLCSSLIIGGIIAILLALQHDFLWVGVVVLFIMVFVLIGTIAIAPLRIDINDDCVIIKKRIGKEKINRSDIVNVYPYEKKGFNVRLFGSGGVFGYLGIFTNKEEGRYKSYVGDYD